MGEDRWREQTKVNHAAEDGGESNRGREAEEGKWEEIASHRSQ